MFHCSDNQRFRSVSHWPLVSQMLQNSIVQRSNYVWALLCPGPDVVGCCLSRVWKQVSYSQMVDHFMFHNTSQWTASAQIIHHTETNTLFIYLVFHKGFLISMRMTNLCTTCSPAFFIFPHWNDVACVVRCNWNPASVQPVVCFSLSSWKLLPSTSFPMTLCTLWKTASMIDWAAMCHFIMSVSHEKASYYDSNCLIWHRDPSWQIKILCSLSPAFIFPLDG